MTSIKALAIALSLAMFLLDACTAPSTGTKAATSEAQLAHPDAIAGNDWKVGDTCVNEYRFGFKPNVHTAIVTDVSGGRATLADTADDGSVRVVVYQGTDGDLVAKRVALSDGQQIEFAPPMKWLNFPLKPGDAWSYQGAVKGQTFQMTLSAKYDAMAWETVTVPAGQFTTVKVVSEEMYTAGRTNKGESFTGAGTVTYWIAPDIKCPIKWQYKNTFGAKTTVQLVSYKAG